jgi:hypothetical protein
MKNHKLREEYATIQMQRQQFEMRLSQVQEVRIGGNEHFLFHNLLFFSQKV